MKKIIGDFNNWCIKFSGLLSFFTIIVAIVIAILANSEIKLGNAFASLIDFLNLKIQLPFYLILMIILPTAIYIHRVRKNYKKRKISPSWLVGKWRNQWTGTGDGHSGFEDLEILKDGSYITGGEHVFDLENVKYDSLSKQISFLKVPARPPEIDNRPSVKDKLIVTTEDLLIGTEENCQIRYTRIK